MFGATRDDEASARDGLAFELCGEARRDGERGGFGAVRGEDEVVRRVVLAEERREVRAQALVEPAARDEDGGLRHVERAARVELAPEEGEVAEAPAQRRE